MLCQKQRSVLGARTEDCVDAVDVQPGALGPRLARDEGVRADGHLQWKARVLSEAAGNRSSLSSHQARDEGGKRGDPRARRLEADARRGEREAHLGHGGGVGHGDEGEREAEEAAGEERAEREERAEGAAGEAAEGPGLDERADVDGGDAHAVGDVGEHRPCGGGGRANERGGLSAAAAATQHRLDLPSPRLLVLAENELGARQRSWQRRRRRGKRGNTLTGKGGDPRRCRACAGTGAAARAGSA